MEGSKLKRAVFLIVAIHVLGSILVGCGPSAIKVGIVPWKMETSRDDGSQREVFYSFSSPRTSHPPGYVFRTSEASPSDIWVTTLAAQEKIEETSNPLTETDIEVSANTMARFVGIVDVGGEKRKGLKIKLAFEGCTREAISEVDLIEIISNANINFKPDEKYFVIQETIKARSVSMEFDRYNSLDANLRAQIDSMDMGGALRKSRVEKVTITKDFEVPHRICYKAVRIDASGPLSSGSRDVILTPDDSAVVVD